MRTDTAGNPINDNAPMYGCSGCNTTAGRLGCPTHGLTAHREPFTPPTTPAEKVVGMLVVGMRGIRDHDLDEYEWAADMVTALNELTDTGGSEALRDLLLFVNTDGDEVPVDAATVPDRVRVHLSDPWEDRDPYTTEDLLREAAAALAPASAPGTGTRMFVVAEHQMGDVYSLHVSNKPDFEDQPREEVIVIRPAAPGTGELRAMIQRIESGVVPGQMGYYVPQAEWDALVKLAGIGEPSAAPRRPDPTNCQQEPPYPAHDMVVTSLRSPEMTVHDPSERCAIQEPHAIADCGEFRD